MQYPATLKPQQALHYWCAPELPRICIRPTLFMLQRKQTQLPARESKGKVQPKDLTLTVKRQAHAFNQLPELPLAELSPSFHFIDIFKNK